MRHDPPPPVPRGGGTTATLITTWYGVFLAEEGEILDREVFPEDPGEIAARLELLEAGEILDEERAIVEDRDAFMVGEERLMHLPGATFAELDVMPQAVEDAAPDPELLRQASISEAERQVTEVRHDQLVIQAVEAMDELQRIENLLDERLREWEPIAEDAPDTHRGILEDVQALREDVAEARQDLEDHVTESVQELAPNTSQLATPGVAARLISQAGGLEDLATMSSGTIQTLGAEEALFAHIAKGAAPPKHGVIFQNPEIHGAPFKARGKISRALAGKLAIAARADAFTGGEIADELEAELKERIERARKES